MPTFRRTSVANRQQQPSSNNALGSNVMTSGNKHSSSSSGPNDGRTFNSDPSAPKHISISYSSSDHDLLYESVVLLFTASALLLQLLHLYRSVWWLPQSYVQFAVKFYLVNPYLVGYAFSLLLPRWLWAFCKTAAGYLMPVHWQMKTRKIFQLIILISSAASHVYCAVLVALEDNTNYETYIPAEIDRHFRLSCLLYPVLFLVAVYRSEIFQYLELVPENCHSGDDASTVQRQTCDVQHKCSNDPVKVRQEVEYLRKDFNNRLRNVLFHSYNTALTCTLFPCCFAQAYIHFDLTIVMQHVILVWIGSFTLNAIHAFPPKYCDVLHCSAKHLGYWDYDRTASPAATLNCVDWCSQTVWRQGSIVKSDSEVYRARGDLNSAQPGSFHHERFYALFINAALLPICLLVLQLALVAMQFVLLLRSNEWYQMISLSLLQASGGYVLFKLTRDSVVVWRLSLAEDLLKNA